MRLAELASMVMRLTARTKRFCFGQRYLLAPSSASPAVYRCSAFSTLAARLISRLTSRIGSYVLLSNWQSVHFTCAGKTRQWTHAPGSFTQGGKTLAVCCPADRYQSNNAC